MKIAGFGFSKYKKTTGREGDGFIATLTYNGKPVAVFEDFGDGAGGNIRYEKSGWGQKELISVIHEIDDALPIEFLRRDSLYDCGENMCELLNELREMERTCRRSNKAASEHSYILMLLTGDIWHCVISSRKNWRESVIITYILNSIPDMAAAWKEAVGAVKDGIARGKHSDPTGILLYKPGTSTDPFDLSVKQYISIFQDVNNHDFKTDC